MGFDARGKEKSPIPGIDLNPVLPSQGDNILKKKQGFLKEGDKFQFAQLISLIRSDGTVEVDAMDDLADLLEYLYDNKATIFPMYGLVTDPAIMKDIIGENDSTSIGSKVWTTPAGKIRIYIVISIVNNTANFNPKILVTPSGGVDFTGGSSASTTGVIWNLLSAGYYGGIQAPLIVDEGDSVTVTDRTFTAGDNMGYTIGYVELTK